MSRERLSSENGERLFVKICGITEPGGLEAAIENGADAVGFVFSESKRKVSPDTVRRLASVVPPGVVKVGVFVDEKADFIERAVEECFLDMVQLHGGEPPEFCARIAVPAIKAVRLRCAEMIPPLHLLGEYRVRYYLLDTLVNGSHGGTGVRFDWRLAVPLKRFGKVLLAGGLNAANVASALDAVRPQGVDVSSGVESGGRKDPVKIAEFIREVRKWELAESRAERKRDISGITEVSTSPKR